MWAIVFAAAAYLLGSLSFAVIVSRALGLPDPRSYGSGNAGATNVLRSGSKLAAALTLLGDLLKGLLAVLLARLAAAYLQLGEAPVAGATLAVMLGHSYPVFFQFKGGKGVATALGVLLALSWQMGLIVAIVWVITVLIWRISSLGAIVAAALAPFLAMHFFGNHVFTAAVVALTVFVLWRHRGNVQKLLAGSEGKIGQVR